MTDTLIFPKLGWEFTLDPILFRITDSWFIRWYGLIIATAFLLAMFYIFRRIKDFGLDEDRVIDVLLGSVLAGIVGARIYFVLFSWDTYKGDLWSIFRIWEGGIAVYGGIIGGVLVGILLCRWRKVPLLPMLDLASGGLLLGQAIGRWGNFVNIEAFGTNTNLPWGMTSSSIVSYLTWNQEALAKIGVEVDPTLPVHPTFFYESIWCLLGYFFIAWYTNKRRFDGELALFYLGWYGLGRFAIEGLRTDSLMVGTIRVSQIVALICVLVSVVTFFMVRSRIRRSGNPDYRKLYVHTPEGRAVLAGTFYDSDKAANTPEEASSQPEESSGKSTHEETEAVVPASPEDEQKEAKEPLDQKDSSAL